MKKIEATSNSELEKMVKMAKMERDGKGKEENREQREEVVWVEVKVCVKGIEGSNLDVNNGLQSSNSPTLQPSNPPTFQPRYPTSHLSPSHVSCPPRR